MADFNEPTNATTYSTVLGTLNSKIASVAKMDFTSDTNLSTGFLRLNPTTGLVERWSGSAWEIKGYMLPSSSANVATFTGDLTIASGELLLGSGSASVPTLAASGDTNTGLFFPAADAVAFTTGGSERVRITSAGDVGIGQQAPTNAANFTTLHLAGVNGSRILFERTAATAVTRGIYSDDSGIGFRDYSASTNLFFVTPTGSMGIGTSAPSELLHLKSSAPRIRFEDTDAGSASIYGQISGNATDGSVFIQADLGNAAAGSAIGFVVDATERARFDSNGRLGIGTTSPSNPLEVVSTNTIVSSRSTSGYASFSRNAATGNPCYDFYLINGVETARIAALSDTIIFHTGSSATERMRILSTGDVGIGATSTGGYRVSIVGSAASSKILYLHTDATAAYVYSPTAVNIGSTGSANLNFVTNNTVRATVHSTGAFSCTGIYDYLVGVTNRDCFVDSNGFLGYTSSVRASKTDIENLNDTSWLFELEPVSFKYRKRDGNGGYLEESEGGIQYGLVAEDVEQIRQDLCFYDEVNGQQELRGIQYSKLTVVLLRAIQQLKERIEVLENN